MDSGSVSEHSEKHSPEHAHTAIAKLRDVDVAAALDSDKPLDPEVAARLRKKIDWHLMPLMCIMYLMAFADKITLGQSAVLGILPGANLTQNQFNWLGTVFYLSYLAFEYPQNLALQTLPVASTSSSGVSLFYVMQHASLLEGSSLSGSFSACAKACQPSEWLTPVGLQSPTGAITPGFMIVTSMFYTRAEQNKRVGYWFLMNGFAIIFLGFVSFGVLHTKTENFMPWQWLMIITGIITLVTAVLFWFFFPDSPTTAYFLTPEERAQAVQRIKINQAGVENKHWKRDQFIEAFTDPKVWVMALFAAVGQVNVVNSLTNQRQLIINQFGFTPIQTTLLGSVDGVVEILTIWLGVSLVAIPALGRGYTAVMCFVPALLGSILVSTLPSHNRIGLLFSYWIAIFVFVPFVILLGWMGTITSGHTKKTTVNAIVLCAYAIGNAAGPFMWKKHYQPRNHVPWAVISACIFTCAMLMLLLRFMLASENKNRDAEKRDDTYDDVYITEVTTDGKTIEKRVDRAFLDLTDIQNRDFRYVL
ncbi:hypothetical protein NLJ89_g522 [Agrocybe chaxingu]|uniref:Uncharacterized protein n=1 Tax=Agrocybe chaxingu TaxID=84603 RepID=A0A9W8N1Q1_9AGAR|nr:hypothetical protein NLJ89_g522 [Agrocybe chaxingu]